MPRTMIRPDAQIAATDSLASNLPSGAPADQTLADNLLSIRSGVARALGTTNFYDPLVADPAGVTRSNADLNQAVYALRNQTELFWTSVYTNVPMVTGTNYVILQVAKAQAPTLPLALGASSQGAVVATSTANGAAFAANELTALAGTDQLYPKNLVRLRNAADDSPVEDTANTQDIFGLLTVESTGVDQAVANDTSGGQRVKISFVEVNPSTKQLIAVPAANVPNLNFNYSYKRRTPQYLVPEDAGLGVQYVDNIGAVDVTLTRAVANQGTTAVAVPASILWQVASGQSFAVQNASGGQTFLNITPGATGGTVAVNATSATVTTTAPTTFSQGVQVATASTPVNVGATAGQVDAPGLTLASTGASPLKLNAGAQVAVHDGYIGGSNWTSSALNVASGVADYNAYKSTFGEVSLLAATVAASQHANRAYLWADVTPAVVAAGTNVTGVGNNANLNVQLPAYDKVAVFTRDVKVWLNTGLLRPGASAASGQDYYPGTTPANGDLMFNFALHGTAGLPGAKADAIAVEVFGGY